MLFSAFLNAFRFSQNLPEVPHEIPARGRKAIQFPHGIHQGCRGDKHPLPFPTMFACEAFHCDQFGEWPALHLFEVNHRFVTTGVTAYWQFHGDIITQNEDECHYVKRDR